MRLSIFCCFRCWFRLEIYIGRWQAILYVSSSNAIDFHWRCAEIGYNTDACYAWCPSWSEVSTMRGQNLWKRGRKKIEGLGQEIDIFIYSLTLDAVRRRESFHGYYSSGHTGSNRKKKVFDWKKRVSQKRYTTTPAPGCSAQYMLNVLLNNIIILFGFRFCRRCWTVP